MPQDELAGVDIYTVLPSEVVGECSTTANASVIFSGQRIKLLCGRVTANEPKGTDLLADQMHVVAYTTEENN